VRGKTTFEKRKIFSNVFFLMCLVRILPSGRVFEKCIHDVSQKEEIRPYALSIYVLKAAADDLEPLRRPR
jgi:hypothetical protein